MSVVAVPTLYRVVRGEMATQEDFTSPMMLRRPPRRIEREHPEEWTGLSMFDSVGQAREAARDFPRLGSFVATMQLDPRRTVARQTFRPGHYTAWGHPDDVLAAVVSVIPI